jgi:FtsP/CotA-like multicopper oxidase with cupredoxin domain
VGLRPDLVGDGGGAQSGGRAVDDVHRPGLSEAADVFSEDADGEEVRTAGSNRLSFLRSSSLAWDRAAGRARGRPTNLAALHVRSWASSASAQSPTPASGGNPEAYYSGVLEYGQATFTIGGETLTTRAYRQEGGAYSIPGPTLTMVPGNKYVLRFRNLLPYQAASPEHNVFKDPNVTNLHTHGVHISGESPGDDVTRFVEGGYGADYVYDIPAEHMGGTYWYHAHHHGSTFLQVSSGAFGQIIIDDSNDGVPANVDAMAERQLLVAYLDPSVAGTGGDTLISGSLGATWTVNGLVQGNLCTTQNEWQHWRVLLADRVATEKTLGVGVNCEVALLARDGVWRTSAPSILGNRSLSLTGASRADLAVRCTNDSVITINGNPIANILSGAGNTVVGPWSNGASGTTWSAIRPDYLRDLRGASGVHNETIRMGARTVNGSKFDLDVPNLTLPATQVQNWSVTGNNAHPFHLHVYHMQAQADCGGAFEPGEYYDTLSQSCGQVRPERGDRQGLRGPHHHALPHPRARGPGR